ncbi:MAG: molybdenum cofactor guanylyltransferase [Pyrinomonadaceae bacterium MAG19_C2-C3]|nr:molybdenum cofactor guanylyltransferase [Pyrinomonadaceae bacterium MAG19_C2-C3]
MACTMNDAKMIDLEAFVLVGGLSRRMGTPKHRLMFETVTATMLMTERIARTLEIVARRPVRLVVHGDEVLDPRLAHRAHVKDVYAERSALTAVHAALAHADAAWVAVVACDLPFVTSDLFARLAALSSGYDTVVPVDEAARTQPLCALYRPAACLPAATTLLDAGEHRAGALLETVATRFVTHDELADLDAATQFFFNVNTPEDYERARLMRFST